MTDAAATSDRDDNAALLLTDLLAEVGRAPEPSAPVVEAVPANAGILVCSAPANRSGPTFSATLRRPLALPPAEGFRFPPPPHDKGSPYAAIACVMPKSMTIFAAFDVAFEQGWNLTDLTLGDLASTIALAPGEQLTLEFQSSQRKVLDQSTVDSTDSITSSESTTSDKESVNVTRASSKTQGWHVDTTGTLTCGYASLSVTAGVSQSVTESNSQAINHVSDTTRKSAQSLKSLHKIEVRGVTETAVQDRMTRVLKNPYPDRTLSINVFQLLKHYSVTTKVAETRAAIVFRFDDLAFDESFVRSYSDFLRANLLDSLLLDQLPTAVAGAIPPLPTSVRKEAIDTAKRALRFLYSYDGSADNMFDVQHIGPPAANPNPPGTSFHAQIGDHSGLEDALRNHSEGLFAVLNYFWSLVNSQVPDPLDPTGNTKIKLVDLDDQAIRIATALAGEARAQWTLLYPDPVKQGGDLQNLFDQSDYTEIFRRVPGFLTIVERMLQPLLDPAQVEQDALRAFQQAQGITERLINHLECNRHFYIASFLRYLHEATNGSSTTDYARDQVLRWYPTIPDTFGFDFDRAYIDRTEIVLPSYGTLTNAQIGDLLRRIYHTNVGDPADPEPVVLNDLQVPADGIHLEAAPGTCVLHNLPNPGTETVDISLKDVEFHAGSSTSAGT